LTVRRSLQAALLFAAVVSFAPARAAAPEGSPLVVGATLTYRYAVYRQDLVDEEPLGTQFGFTSCQLVPVHGVDPGAFRVECEGGPKDAAIGWGPWKQSGYYAWRDDGLHHVANRGQDELTLAREPEVSQWTGRSILVLGEPIDAFCPLHTEAEDGQTVFEEVCWTPTHGPVFFVGVDTSEDLKESTWELLTVSRTGEVEAATVTTAKAEKLIKAWLWTQNASRFDNYGWLYGAVFHGVERGVAGAGSFDRTGWLRKRQPLFKRRTRVRIEDMKILTAGDITVVLFEQHRNLGGRMDHGLRELRLSLERGRVVIAREEMLYALAQ
jgi:hypothetical protein